MKPILLIVVAAFVSACAGAPQREPTTPVTHIPEQGGWFCQMSRSGDGWECVQDPQLAADPRPERIPEPTPPPEPVSSPDPVPLPTRVPGEAPQEAPDPDPPPGPPPEPAPAPPPPRAIEASVTAPEGAPRGEPAPVDASLPEYVRLAYRPERPMALTELPKDFYAVQLLAMTSKEALEAFVDRQGIQGMSAARVERDGELYYVLLLGVYETQSVAQQAAASLPREIEGTEPWIRPLGSLQAAMLRADRMVGSARY